MAKLIKAFVCGHPISHSRSPLIHETWLKQHQIMGTYERIDIAPTALPDFINTLKHDGWSGGNFTIPHKETVFDLVDEIDDAARAIGAANTLWFENGILWAGNTDAYGFSANLDDQIPTWRSAQTAIVFGAGGASRAIIFALLSAGIREIKIINRTLERAEKLVADFGGKISAHIWDEAEKLLNIADLIINTTSLGMDKNPEFPISLSNVKPDCLASDIVYVPLETPFLKMAKEQGLQYSDGLGMLLHQAVPGFEKWFGVRPKVDNDVRNVILDDFGMAQKL